MNTILSSAQNGAIQGAKVGGIISAASFLAIVGVLSYDISRSSRDKGNITVAAALFGLMIFSPAVCAISGVILGATRGFANGIHTTLYDNRRKLEVEIVLPQYKDDQLITLRKTRQIELT